MSPLGIDQILKLKAQRDKLLDLLAIIHRDGGHYTEEVGIDLSIEHAHKIWAKLQEDLAKYLAQRDALALLETEK